MGCSCRDHLLRRSAIRVCRYCIIIIMHELLLPKRRPVRLSKFNYLGHQIYFATLCSFQKAPVFRKGALCKRLLELLSSEATAKDFSILAYCLMPDHLHFLAKGLRGSSDFLHILKTFKLKSSRNYALLSGGALWQRGFFEHVLRPTEPVESFAWYIWLNPVRRGLVSSPEEYPYSGSFSGLHMPLGWTNRHWRPNWK